MWKRNGCSGRRKRIGQGITVCKKKNKEKNKYKHGNLYKRESFNQTKLRDLRREKLKHLGGKLGTGDMALWKIGY